MSYPTEVDAAIIRVGNGANPEVFSIICGIENVTINRTAGTSDRFRVDCAKPGMIPTRSVRVTNRQWDLTGAGVANADQITALYTALGSHQNFEVDLIRYDGTDEGESLGVLSGPGVMTAANMNLQRAADSTMDISIAGENDPVWTPAA